MLQVGRAVSPPSSTVSPPIVREDIAAKESENIEATVGKIDDIDEKGHNVDKPPNVKEPTELRSSSRSGSPLASAVSDSSKMPGLVSRPTPEPQADNQPVSLFHGQFPIFGTRFERNQLLFYTF